MTHWRFAASALLALFVALPLAWPLGTLSPGVFGVESHLPTLARNTALLAGGTVAVALPLGGALAVLIERTDMPGRRLATAALCLSLFVPLPLFVTGWQVVLPWFSSAPWAPWATGLPAAVFLHAAQAVPWVALIVGVGLRAVERDLEDDARLIGPPAWVLWHVTLRRAAPSIVAAALWVMAQTSAEIAVTDLMQVRTFAEEVYRHLNSEDAEPIGRAVAGSLLGVAACVVGVSLAARRVDRLVPDGDVSYRECLRLELGRGRWPLASAALALSLALFAVPTVALVYRAGLSGSWSFVALASNLATVSVVQGERLMRSLLVAAASGLLAATAALVACWLARGSRWFGRPLLVLLAVAWATPGPLFGLGLKGVIELVLRFADPVSALPARLLYYGPSALPLVWVNFVRFLPFAAALVWPAVRRLPPELFDLARLDGLPPSRELLGVVWPLTRSAWAKAALAVAVLSLGELSAGKLVSTPGADGFAEFVWGQMHYGVSAHLAAMCLLLLAAASGGAALWYNVAIPSREVAPCRRQT